MATSTDCAAGLLAPPNCDLDTTPEVLFDRVAAEFAAPLARLVRAHEADPTLQQDLLQEIHLALWRSLRTFDRRCSLRTWVHRVAHHVAATHVLRSRRRRARQFTTLDDASLPDEIRAWARIAGGDLHGALTLLRPVADRQAKIGKGEVELPAREMLADMLLMSGKFPEASTEYEKSLASDPNRFNALLGAGQAAERLGKVELAASYYRALLANCSCASGEAAGALEHARSFVSAMATS